jgi:hypothetical protein
LSPISSRSTHSLVRLKSSICLSQVVMLLITPEFCSGVTRGDARVGHRSSVLLNGATNARE